MIWDGQLKIKESIQPMAELISHRHKNTKKIIQRTSVI